MRAHRHGKSLFLKWLVILGFSADLYGNVHQNPFASSVFRLCHWTARPPVAYIPLTASLLTIV